MHYCRQYSESDEDSSFLPETINSSLVAINEPYVHDLYFSTAQYPLLPLSPTSMYGESPSYVRDDESIWSILNVYSLTK